VLILGTDVVHGRIAAPVMLHVLARCESCLFTSTFWFVPNLLFALALLLLFERFLHDVRIGLVFLMASLFYGVNLYGHWLPVTHAKAFFGFVFYLWLGAWCAWNFPALERRLARIPASVMLGLIFLSFSLALAESKLLTAFGSIDSINTLRISNQIYSLVLVLGIVKVKRAMWPRFVNVRRDTYGLYLSHTIWIIALGAVLRRFLPHCAPLSLWRENAVGLSLIVAIFCLSYAACLLGVRAMILSPYLRWSVGISAPGGARNAPSAELGFDVACEAEQSVIS
jgi:membrane-bound acyltransferase YfiQ involved in biofilm formation